jgi:hypothetical protein
MMKKFNKAVIALVLAAAMILPLTGCSLKDEAAGSQYTDDEVIAKVGDTEITLGDYQELFNYYLQYYQSYGSDPTSSQESLEAFQDDIMNALLQEKVIPYQAKQQLGLNLLLNSRPNWTAGSKRNLKAGTNISVNRPKANTQRIIPSTSKPA